MDKYECLKLKNQICFPLYACSKEIIKKYKPILDKLNLTYTQYITMMLLWEKDNINVKTLGECLYLDSGTLSPMLKTMEKKGLITKVREKTDERNILIKLTPKGNRLKDKSLGVPKDISKCVNLSPDEATTFYNLLYKILKELKEN